MNIKKKEVETKSIKLSIEHEGKEVARAHLFLIQNQLHDEPYGLMEDVFVEESMRGKGLGSKIISELIETAKKSGCYKLICTSRNSNERVHELYQKKGFEQHGLEFRMNF